VNAAIAHAQPKVRRRSEPGESYDTSYTGFPLSSTESSGYIRARTIEAMTTEWEDDGRREVMQEFAEAAASEGNHFFYVRIPGDIQPLEREERLKLRWRSRWTSPG
jgi:hypothetical protein